MPSLPSIRKSQGGSDHETIAIRSLLRPPRPDRPADRFADLSDYPFEPNYVEVSDGEGASLRIHFLDEGPSDAAPVLLLHGEPSWSYLYRHMIPPFVAAGHRVVVPDLVGFGRSDKPTETSDYTYGRHVAWMREALLERLDRSSRSASSSTVARSPHCPPT